MAEAAGVDGDDTGTSVVVGRYNFADDSVLGVVFQHTDDLFSTAFSDLRRPTHPVGKLGSAARRTASPSSGASAARNSVTSAPTPGACAEC